MWLGTFAFDLLLTFKCLLNKLCVRLAWSTENLSWQNLSNSRNENLSSHEISLEFSWIIIILVRIAVFPAWRSRRDNFSSSPLPYRCKQMCLTHFFLPGNDARDIVGPHFVSPPLIRPHSLHVFAKNLRSPRPSIFRTGELNLAIRYRRTDGTVGWDRRTNRQTGTHRTAGARRRILVRPKGEPASHFLSRRFCVCSNLQQSDSSSMRL